MNKVVLWVIVIGLSALVACGIQSAGSCSSAEACSKGEVLADV